MTGLTIDRSVFIQEVAPRDGLQIEPTFLDTNKKIALIDALSKTGVTKIEVTSFVSPKSIPNLRDAREVATRIARNSSIRYVALVPNLRGAREAVATGIDEINLVMSASQTHNLANMNMTCEQSLSAFKTIAKECTATTLNGTVATAFGCPFDGDQTVDRILSIIDCYLRLGCTGITLADTTGMANPRQVETLISRVLVRNPSLRLALHFHNTRGMGLANVIAALHAGANRFDASLGGTGGCPFAPGATGNICTEDLVHMLEGMGIETGIDLPALITLSKQLATMLGHDLPGYVAKAGRSCDLHSPPASTIAPPRSPPKN